MAKSLKRSSSTRNTLKRYHILCEGKNTEPDYFQCLVDHFQAANVDIVLVPAAGAPQTIAAKADEIRQRKGKRLSFEEGDEVWAVFDRDKHEQYDGARLFCKQKGINVAYSDPCFELWLILHHHQVNAPESHHEIQKNLSPLMPPIRVQAGSGAIFNS